MFECHLLHTLWPQWQTPLSATTLDSPTSARGAPQIATCSVGNTDITLINRTLTSQCLKSYLCSKNGDNLINKTLPDQLVIGVNVDKRQWSWDRVCPSGNACQMDHSWDDACSINMLQGWLDSTPCDTVSVQFLIGDEVEIFKINGLPTDYSSQSIPGPS